MPTEKRTLTTAWNHQDQKKERVNVCIKIWQEKSNICFYLFSIPILETDWRNHQVGNWAFKTGLFVSTYYFFFGRIVDLNLICHFLAAQLACDHSLNTLSFPLPSLNTHISFPMGCSATFLVNVSPRSNIAYFFHDFQDIIPLPPSSSPEASPIFSLQGTPSLQGTLHMQTCVDPTHIYIQSVSVDCLHQFWLSLQSWCCYVRRKI